VGRFGASVAKNIVGGYHFTCSCRCYFSHNEEILSAFARLQKATTSFVMSVCPSVYPREITPASLDGFS